MTAASLAAVLAALAGVVTAVTALVKAVQAGRKLDAHTAQCPGPQQGTPPR